MTKNTHNIDRIVRVVIAIAAFAGAFAVGGGLLGIVLGLVGVIMLATAAMSFCPIYAILGMSTLPKKNESA